MHRYLAGWLLINSFIKARSTLAENLWCQP